jgi:hypothetical protein
MKISLRILGWTVWFVPFLWLAMQIPFLTVDPDTLVDIHTRGAWTDEGLYTASARNFLNTGDLSVTDDSVLIRGPLYTIIQIPFFAVFGQSLPVARCITLFLLLILMWLFLRDKSLRTAGLFFLVAGLTQFHLFQFSHYAMAEIPATVMILASLLLMVKAYNTDAPQKKQIIFLLLSAIALFAAYAIKIQFIYIAALLPGFAFLLWIFSVIRRDGYSKIYLNKFALTIAFTLAFTAIYLLAWYLPHREFYNLVMLRETDARYPSELVHILGQSRFNFTELLFVPFLKPLLVTGGVALLGGLTWIILRPRSWRIPERLLFFGSVLWLMMELHKVPMTYMPHRYMVPAYAAVALMTAAVVSVIWRQRRAFAIPALTIMLLLAAFQLSHTLEAWQRRSHDLREVNRYMKNYDWNGETITGTWAASISWQTRAKVLPLWRDFMNEDKVSGSRMLVAESDQDDSKGSLANAGSDLTVQADSVKRFPLWRYSVDLIWLSRESSR